MSAAHIVVLVTVPSEEIALKVAEILLQQRAAACVNILPGIRSLYIWKDQRCDEQEWLLLCKTRTDQFETRFVPAVKSVHPYEVPEIIALPIIAGSSDYLAWIDEVVTPSLHFGPTQDNLTTD
ncbi:MAG: divalent-cation tolerance protein CutA [Anaerolineaceae bacterium]|nr:divalent-cation tolerance protein CutA [Anaerolineaceae bacterium]